MGKRFRAEDVAAEYQVGNGVQIAERRDGGDTVFDVYAAGRLVVSSVGDLQTALDVAGDFIRRAG